MEECSPGGCPGTWGKLARRWTCSFGERSGKPGSGQRCSRIPRSPGCPLSADSDFPPRSRARTSAASGPCRARAGAAAPARVAVWGTGASCGWGCSKQTPRGHPGVTAQAPERGQCSCTHQRTWGHPGRADPKAAQSHPLFPQLSSTEPMAESASPPCSCPEHQDLEAMGYLFLPFAPWLSPER